MVGCRSNPPADLLAAALDAAGFRMAAEAGRPVRPTVEEMVAEEKDRHLFTGRMLAEDRRDELEGWIRKYHER